MKPIFYVGAFSLIAFEIAKVFFIMPFPGSQEINSIDLAYLLHSWRWIFRGVFVVMILLGLKLAWKGSRILPPIVLLIAAVVFYMTNFKMVADHMFRQPKNLTLLNVSENSVDTEKLIIGVTHNNEAKAYPIQFLGFHHQVRDSVGGKPVMVTYCTVCRTGRVFEPAINGKPELFRLVGMDHYNAMFEDQTTHSWWRQETGEAIAGPLKGDFLNEVPSTQASLKNWIALHPNTLIMQADTSFQSEYDSLANYEAGKRKGRLTRRDTASWEDKSWIAGIVLNQESKAYDWNILYEKQIINDVVSTQPVVVFLAEDHKSLFAYKRNNPDQIFSIRHDTLSDGITNYNLLGYSYSDPVKKLEPLQVYQEYWHSWRFFHPNTLREP